LRLLSEQGLAFSTVVDDTCLGGIETGERNPSLKDIAAIAEALGVTLSELFSFGNRNQESQLLRRDLAI